MTISRNQFIEFLIAHNALQFGEFTLKSGRVSPYFFNLGVFHTGSALEKLGEFYAQALLDSGFTYDILFGPAYKGIPLVAATSIVLAKKLHHDVAYCFNRKEKKVYGDGGNFVGAELTGQVVMLDDVITAGTTVHETVSLLKNTPAHLSGVIIALDRQERGQSNRSAVQETAKKYGVPIQSIIRLDDIVRHLSTQKSLKKIYSAIERYRDQYGAL